MSSPLMVMLRPVFRGAELALKQSEALQQLSAGKT